MTEWPQLQTHILDLERRGLITRTFRRLDPARQQAIVQAILDESAQRGPTAIRIRQVAARAHVSVGSLYQYFGRRENLLGFAVTLCVRFMTDAFTEFRPYLAELSLEDALASYLSYGIEWSQTQLGFVQFFGRAAYQGDPELADKVVRPIAAAMHDTMRDLLAAAAARGEIRPDVDLEAAARVINALMIAVGDSQLLPYLNDYFQLTDEAMPPERVLQALLGVVRHGVEIEG